MGSFRGIVNGRFTTVLREGYHSLRIIQDESKEIASISDSNFNYRQDSISAKVMRMIANHGGLDAARAEAKVLAAALTKSLTGGTNVTKLPRIPEELETDGDIADWVVEKLSKKNSAHSGEANAVATSGASSR